MVFIISSVLYLCSSQRKHNCNIYQNESSYSQVVCIFHSHDRILLFRAMNFQPCDSRLVCVWNPKVRSFEKNSQYFPVVLLITLYRFDEKISPKVWSFKSVKAIEKTLRVLRFVVMYDVVLKRLILWMKPSRVTTQWKAVQQYLYWGAWY